MLFDAVFPKEAWVPGESFAHAVFTPPDPAHHEWLDSIEAITYFPWPLGVNCRFGPALFSSADESNVLHAMTAWASVFGEGVGGKESARQLGLASLLPPTVTADNGEGYDYYWLTREIVLPDKLEQANAILVSHVQASPDYISPNSVLRVPGPAYINDQGAAIPTSIVDFKADIYIYTIKDILSLEHVDNKLLHIVRTGEIGDFADELERDKYVVQALLKLGFSTEAIEIIFTAHLVGSAYRLRGWGYLSEIVDSLVTKRENQVEETNHELLEDDELGISEHPDGIYAKQRGSGTKRISTFLITPELLAGNYVVVSLQGKGKPIKLILPHSAFHSSRALLTHVGNHPRSVNEGLSYTGTDNTTKNLFAFLIRKAEMLNVRRVQAVSTLGRHGKTFVLPSCSISIHGIVPQDQAKIIYNDPKKGKLRITISPSGDITNLAQKVAILLPQLNKPEVIWPVIGWMFASLHKPQLEDLGWRFPFLCLFGIRGSGKTNLIHTAMLRLFGYTSTGGTSADTTKFVMLALFASSNALPVSFSEFSHAGQGVKDLVSYLKLAYDTGYDPRGKTDQTTIEYSLTAPVVLDGEELVDDPAARERMIAIAMSPQSIAPGSDCFQAFRELEKLEINRLAEYIYCESLKIDLAAAISWAEQDFNRMSDLQIPDRVRRNYIVCQTGCLIYSQIFNTEAPDVRAMRPSLEEVLGQVRGGQIVADEFVEDLITSLPIEHVDHICSKNGNVVTIQLHKAYIWWKLRRRRAGDKAPPKSTLLAQLKERRETYIESVTKGEAGLLISINLAMAAKEGLEVPTKLGIGIRLRTKKGG